MYIDPVSKLSATCLDQDQACFCPKKEENRKAKTNSKMGNGNSIALKLLRQKTQTREWTRSGKVSLIEKC